MPNLEVELGKILGASISVIGSSHLKTNLECQDYSTYYSSNSLGIAIVCDGHGSKKHFRSSKGAELASLVATEAIKEFMKHKKSFTKNKDQLLQQLEKNIIFSWNNSVNKHYNENKFTEEEVKDFSIEEKSKILENIVVAYGTTLIAVAMTSKSCFGIQIGDGDCVKLDKSGNLTMPIPKDERLQFNITTSLCDVSASRNFRHFWVDVPVAAMIVSTDGVGNSFANEKYYLGFCKTLLASMKDMKIEEAIIELKDFLQKLTVDGSGDDVSIAAVFNQQLLDQSQDCNKANGQEPDIPLMEDIDG